MNKFPVLVVFFYKPSLLNFTQVFGFCSSLLKTHSTVINFPGSNHHIFKFIKRVKAPFHSSI